MTKRKRNQISYYIKGEDYEQKILAKCLDSVLGVAVTTTAAGLTSYNLFIVCGIIYIVLFVLVLLFPKIKGTVTALVMIASSLCNYTILTAASKMTLAAVMTMNIVLTAIGVLLGAYVNVRYKKMVELAKEN